MSISAVVLGGAGIVRANAKRLPNFLFERLWHRLAPIKVSGHQFVAHKHATAAGRWMHQQLLDDFYAAFHIGFAMQFCGTAMHRHLAGQYALGAEAAFDTIAHRLP